MFNDSLVVHDIFFGLFAMRNYNWNIVTNKLFKVKFVADFRKQATVARRMQRWIGGIDKSRAGEG